MDDGYGESDLLVRPHLQSTQIIALRASNATPARLPAGDVRGHVLLPAHRLLGAVPPEEEGQACGPYRGATAVFGNQSSTPILNVSTLQLQTPVKHE